MNKIYRCVWNETTQTWVATSELVTTKTKSSTRNDGTAKSWIKSVSRPKRLIGLLISMLLLETQIVAPVLASNVVRDTQASAYTDTVDADSLRALPTSTSVSIDNLNVDDLQSNMLQRYKSIDNINQTGNIAQNGIQTSKRLIDELQKNSVHFDDGTTTFSNQLTRDASNERTISNIADGRVNETSNQAINGRQLYRLSTSTSTSLSQLQDQLNITSNNIPADLSTTLSSLQHDTLRWNGSAYDASHGSGTAEKITNVAAGDTSQNSTDAVNGGQLWKLKDEFQQNSVHFDDGTTSFSNQLTRDASNERTISNIADGRVDETSNQAINGRQLYRLSTSTSTSLSQLQDQLNIASGNIPAELSTTLSSLQHDTLRWNGSAYDASHSSGTAQKITNIAAGDTSQNSTDAVNGGQLWQLKSEWQQDLQALSDSVDNKLAQSGSGNGNTNNSAIEKANQAIADTQKLSTSTADALSAVAASLGGNASYNPLTRDGTGGFTAPSYTTSNADGTAVTANNVGDAINNLYTGGSKYAKVNSTQAVASASGSEAIAVGGAAVASGQSAIAIGSQATASAENGVAIGNHASVTQNGGIALGANSVANTAAGITGYIPATATEQQARAIQATTSTEAAVSVGDATKGIYRQITGVAAGTADTDAVNVAQLKGVNARMDNINRHIDDINDRVHHVERRAYSGTALALALSGAYLPRLDAGEQTVGIGMGSYRGYAAVGINYKAMTKSGNMSWGLGVSSTGRETGFNAGVGFKW